MHELSLANQAVDRIMEVALERRAKKIRLVEILVGDLSLVGKDQLRFWIKDILSSKGEVASGVKIDLKPLKAIIRCNHCGYEGGFNKEEKKDFTFLFRCPDCNYQDIQIIKGRECMLNKVQIEA